MKLQLSNSSEKVLALLFSTKNPLYVNEIIRETHLYPNAVQRSLQTLKKQNIVIVKKVGNKKFYSINGKYKHLSELKAFTNIPQRKKYKYIKWVNRECSVALNTAIGSSQSDERYIKRFRIDPVNFLWYNSVTGGVYNSADEISKIGKQISKEIKKDSKFAKELADSCIKDGGKLINKTKSTLKKDLTNLSNKDLYTLLNEIHELFLHFMPYFVIPHAIENAIQIELDNCIFDPATKEKLIEPVDVISGEQIDELRLAASVKKHGWTKVNNSSLTKLTKKYCWLPLMALHHKPFDIEYFKKVIDELVVSVKNPKKELEKFKQQETERKRILADTLNEINADVELKNLVHTTQAYLKLRTYRVNITKMFHYYHLPLLNEIAFRLELDPEDIPFLTYPEILAGLNMTHKNNFDRLIIKRKKGFANLTWKGKTRVISGVESIIEAIEQYNIRAETPQAKLEVKGKPACRGVATGTVKIVKKPSELDKVRSGDILVARMTTPDYMIAINKAEAIVTDEGGITCHAAIVSREFNIPCIVGTRNATQILRDGDIVEVDANNGTVRIVESVDYPENIETITGTTIFEGKVEGTARIILDASDFNKLKEGDIVIAPQTTPDYLSLLYRAKGFVVDEESISSHAVLYGKALKLPSIMGTSYARNVIEDGEKVELDATKGLVKKL